MTRASGQKSIGIFRSAQGDSCPATPFRPHPRRPGGPPYSLQCFFYHILTVIDRTSRWMEALPLANTAAAEVEVALFSGWICRFGVLAIITSDRAAQFTSRTPSAPAGPPPPGLLSCPGSSWVSGPHPERTPTSSQHRLCMAHHWCSQASN